MKKELFIIIFSDDARFEIMAWSLEEAKILAQAERINRGQPYTVKGWAMCEGCCDTCSRQHVCLD